MSKHAFVLMPFFGASLLLAAIYLLLMPVEELRAAPDALTLEIDRLDDPALPTGNDCTIALNDCTLRGAVSVAAEGATLVIVADGSIVLQQGGITLTKDVTITSASAANHVIDGNESSLIFDIEPDPFEERTIILEELTLQNGFNADDNGGAVRMEAGTLTMRHVILQDNVSGRRGGALSVLPVDNHASVILSDVIFRRNRAQAGALSGGAINIGALFMVPATLIIENSLFENNSGGNFVGGEGGAIMGDARTPGGANLSLTIRNTKFISNNSQIGGALSLRTFTDEPGGSSSIKTSIYDSEFVGNQSGQAGAIFHEAAGNQAQATLVISNTTFATNTATSDGGALYNQSNQGSGVNAINSTVRIFNSTFHNNQSSAGNGGAIYQSARSLGMPAPSHTHLELVNVTFSGNRAGSDAADQGGAIYAFTSNAIAASSRVTATHVTMFDNSVLDNSDIGLHQGGLTANKLYLKNSIITGSEGKSCSNEGDNIEGANNLINDTSCGSSSAFRLGKAIGVIPTLAGNGGPTLTHGLYAGSNALDAVPVGQCTLGDSADDVLTDQRGEARPFGTTCDIGAFEEQSVTPPTADPITGLSASNDGPTTLGSPTAFATALISGTASSYTWNFGDGGSGSSGSDSAPTHIYTDTGLYTATVVASNDTHTLTATTTVYVGDAVVEVGNNFYDPDEVAIPLGGKVVWVLRAGNHSVTDDDGTFEQAEGANWPPFVQTFDTANTFDYHCTVHGVSMAGKIIVGSVQDGLRLPNIIKQEE